MEFFKTFKLDLNTKTSFLDFVLDIKLINTKKQQITIINHSSTFDSSSLVPNVSFANSNNTNDTYFHLNFPPTTKFIEIRRKLALLTNVYANNQEWFYYIVKSDQETSKEETIANLKTYNDLASFHRLIETNKLFAIPLTTLIEDNQTLVEMKKTLDELNSESSVNYASASSSMPSNSPSDSQSNNKLINSKLTPPQAQSKPLSKATQMIFIVTSKNLNNNVNNFEYSSASTSNHHEFNVPHNFVFENVMSIDAESEAFSMNSVHGPSLPLTNPKKAKTNDMGKGKNYALNVNYFGAVTCL